MLPTLTCILTVLFLPCDVATSLPGSGHPSCTPGENVLVSAKVSDLEALPESLLFEVEAERQEASDCTLPIEVVPASIRYPSCVVGHVQRSETVHEEGTIPAREPYQGVCCSIGCACASERCEAIPYGGPRGYGESRAARYPAPEGEP